MEGTTNGSENKKRVRRAKGGTKQASPAAVKAPKAPKAPKVPKPTATGVRSEAARRTAEGKFTKAIFNQIGEKECRRFAAMTWKERDAFMAKPENALVRERYEKHMALVKSETTA